ncbi:signal transduction histidine kinase [Cenarchaeum symbiosum A]|uniref:histidine kinase n=1 Tax=Cenarchaeum symbiosum (strain A) TaxID=414004 RepID=A0RY31_CENSY|nr:signal transduction histidine kinase [Cenarchaeum symbiosum A]
MDYFGSKSITSDFTAMFELIKNSRDANAKNVLIKFKNLRYGSTEIEISDDGDGMSNEDIETKWMVIGTDSRLRDTKTSDGKAVWGEMGIGRLACQRLGTVTELNAVKNGKLVWMEFDWSAFEKPGITVNEVKFERKITDTANLNNGVRLNLKKLKSTWDSKKINKLKSEISTFISKKNFDDIKIRISDGDEKGEIVGRNDVKLREEIINNAPFKMRSVFDGNHLFVDIMQSVAKQNEWKKQDVADSCPVTNIGPFSVDIYHFPRAPGKRKTTDIEQYYNHKIGIKKMEEFLKYNHGIYIYRDGVWLRPYGGEKDWLTLEARARQETSRIGLKQIYGIVHLTKSNNPMIKPAAHRETLDDNKEFDDLQKIMRIMINIFAEYMKHWKEEEIKKLKIDDKEPDPETAKQMVVNIKNNTRGNSPDEKRQIKLSSDGLLNVIDVLQEKAEILTTETDEIKSYEKNLITLGIAASFMARHVTDPLEANMDLLNEGAQIREAILSRSGGLTEDETTRTKEMLDQMEDNQARMLHFMKFVSVMTDHISKSIVSDKSFEQVNILECWQSVAKGFEDKCRDLSIVIKTDSSNPHNREAKSQLVVKLDPIDLDSILTHLYMNSIESIEKSTTDKKEITLHYWHHNHNLHIDFADTGRGIPESKLEEIFEPFKFGHLQDNRQLHGHGLGLYIVRKIMEHYEGKAEAISVDGGALIRLTFPNIERVATSVR